MGQPLWMEQSSPWHLKFWYGNLRRSFWDPLHHLVLYLLWLPLCLLSSQEHCMAYLAWLKLKSSQFWFHLFLPSILSHFLLRQVFADNTWCTCRAWRLSGFYCLALGNLCKTSLVILSHFLDETWICCFWQTGKIAVVRGDGMEATTLGLDSMLPEKRRLGQWRLPRLRLG